MFVKLVWMLLEVCPKAAARLSSAGPVCPEDWSATLAAILKLETLRFLFMLTATGPETGIAFLCLF